MKTNFLCLTVALSLTLSVGVAVQERVLAAAPCNVPTSSETPLLLKPDRNLTLLQPLDDTTDCLPPSPNIQIFFQYFNLGWPWVLGIASGIGLLQALIGAIQVMLSGSDTGMRESGKGKIMWALGGLLMVGLAGFILRSLNPIFYK